MKVLARTPVTLYVAARAMTFGSAGFQWAAYSMPPVVQQASPVDYVLISAPGYPQMKVAPVRIIPIIVGGTTYTMVDLGTVSFPSPTCPTQPRDGAITGTTDSAGNFRVTVGSGTTVSGRLTQCTVKPLPNQTFTVVPKFSGEELDKVKFVVPGYADTTVTQAVSVFRLGSMVSVNVGDVCLLPPRPEPVCSGCSTGKVPAQDRTCERLGFKQDFALVCFATVALCDWRAQMSSNSGMKEQRSTRSAEALYVMGRLGISFGHSPDRGRSSLGVSHPLRPSSPWDRLPSSMCHPPVRHMRESR